MCIWACLFAFNLSCYRAVWWLLPLLRADESQPRSLSGVTWFSVVFYRNAFHKLIDILRMLVYLFSWQVPPQIQPEAVGAAANYSLATPWRPTDLLPLNPHLWRGLFSPSGTLPFCRVWGESKGEIQIRNVRPGSLSVSSCYLFCLLKSTCSPAKECVNSFGYHSLLDGAQMLIYTIVCFFSVWMNQKGFVCYRWELSIPFMVHYISLK